MKITKYPDDMNPYKIAEDLARKECRVCPCCGRKEGVQERLINNRKTDGFFHRKTIDYLSFRCWSCGAQWDSEPFETGEKTGPLFLWIIISVAIYGAISIPAILKNPKIITGVIMILPLFLIISTLLYYIKYEL